MLIYVVYLQPWASTVLISCIRGTLLEVNNQKSKRDARVTFFCIRRAATRVDGIIAIKSSGSSSSYVILYQSRAHLTIAHPNHPMPSASADSCFQLCTVEMACRARTSDIFWSQLQWGISAVRRVKSDVTRSFGLWYFVRKLLAALIHNVLHSRGKPGEVLWINRKTRFKAIALLGKRCSQLWDDGKAEVWIHFISRWDST